MLETTFDPVRPFSLTASAGRADATRRMSAGVLELRFCARDMPARAQIWQCPDGSLRARLHCIDEGAGHDRLRELLRVNDDHTPFLRLARHDPLLRPLCSRMRGVRRPLLGTPEHALLRAVTGQLISSSAAARIEWRIIALVSSAERGLREPPTGETLARRHPGHFARAGLSSARAELLARASRHLPWRRLADADSGAAAAIIRRQPGLGPWSAGVILCAGYGRHDHGLVGDLGLIKLTSALLGRKAEPDDTAELLGRYGEWQGLACTWLLSHPLARDRTAQRIAARRAG